MDTASIDVIDLTDDGARAHTPKLGTPSQESGTYY